MWRYQADSGGGITDHIFQYFPSDFPNLPTTKWATSPLTWRPCPLGAAPVEVRHPHNRRRLELWRRRKKRNLSNLFQQFPKPMAGYAHDIMGNLNAGAAGWIDWNMLLGATVLLLNRQTLGRIRQVHRKITRMDGTTGT